jgi:hypothetical protein
MDLVYHPVIGVPVSDGDNLGIPDRGCGILFDGIINRVVTMFPHKGVGVTGHVKFAFIPVNGNSLPAYFIHRKNYVCTHKIKNHTHKGTFFHGYLQNLMPFSFKPILKRPGIGSSQSKGAGNGNRWPSPGHLSCPGSGGLLFFRLGPEAHRQIAVLPVVCHTVAAFFVVGTIHIRAGTLFHIGTRHVLSPLHSVNFIGIFKTTVLKILPILR